MKSSALQQIGIVANTMALPVIIWTVAIGLVVGVVLFH